MSTKCHPQASHDIDFPAAPHMVRGGVGSGGSGSPVTPKDAD